MSRDSGLGSGMKEGGASGELGSALKQVAAFMGSNVAVMAAQVVSSFLVARWAGPEQMGYFNSASILLSYAPILLLGVNNGLNREIPLAVGAGRGEVAQAMANTAWWWVLAAGLFSGCSVAVAVAFLLGTGKVMMGQAFLAFAFVVPLAYISQNIEVTLRTSHDFMRLSRLKYVTAVLAVASAPLVWIAGWAGLLCRLVGLQTTYSFLLLRNRRIIPRPVLDRTGLARLFKVGIPIFAVGYFYTIFSVMDRTLILRFLSTKDMGFYTPAIQVASALMVIPASVNMIVYPRMCEAYGRTGSTRSLATHAYLPALGLGAAMLPCYALVWWLVDPLVHLALPKYVEGITAARWMVVAQYLHCFSIPQNVFTTINRLVPYALVIAAGITANVLVSVFLVGQGLGLSGIGIGNTCGMAVIVILSSVLAARYVFRRGPVVAGSDVRWGT